MSVFEGKLEEFNEYEEIWTKDTKKKEEYRIALQSLLKNKNNNLIFENLLQASIRRLNDLGINVNKEKILKDLSKIEIENNTSNDFDNVEIERILDGVATNNQENIDRKKDELNKNIEKLKNNLSDMFGESLVQNKTEESREEAIKKLNEVKEELKENKKIINEKTNDDEEREKINELLDNLLNNDEKNDNVIKNEESKKEELYDDILSGNVGISYFDEIDVIEQMIKPKYEELNEEYKYEKEFVEKNFPNTERKAILEKWIKDNHYYDYEVVLFNLNQFRKFDFTTEINNDSETIKNNNSERFLNYKNNHSYKLVMSEIAMMNINEPLMRITDETGTKYSNKDKDLQKKHNELETMYKNNEITKEEYIKYDLLTKELVNNPKYIEHYADNNLISDGPKM